MAYLIDFLCFLIPAAVTALLYYLYYQVFVKGYVRRIKKTFDRGEVEKAVSMKQNALRKHPKRMAKLLADINVNEFDRIKNMVND